MFRPFILALGLMIGGVAAAGDRGVTPTEAGQVLYRHAQIILRQFEQAQSDVNNSGQSLSGQVSVGLAPGTAASALALPLLKSVRARHPSILLYLNENFATTLSELVSKPISPHLLWSPSESDASSLIVIFFLDIRPPVAREER